MLSDRMIQATLHVNYYDEHKRDLFTKYAIFIRDSDNRKGLGGILECKYCDNLIEAKQFIRKLGYSTSNFKLRNGVAILRKSKYRDVF